MRSRACLQLHQEKECLQAKVSTLLSPYIIASFSLSSQMSNRESILYICVLFPCARMPNGGEYLFQSKDDEEMNIWINKINTTTKYASTSSLSGKGAQGESQTMPAPDTGE